MSDVREVLDGIEERAGRVQYLGYQYAVEAENAADARAMLAALRAVLDECDRAKIHTSDGRFVYIPRLESAITEALGGGA